MARLNKEFLTNEVEGEISIEPIPSGNYLMCLTDSELRESKSGDEYLWCEFTLLEDPYRGRKIFNNLNLYHPNSTAREIAERELKSLCLATGIDHLKDTDDLVDIPVIGKVKVRPADGTYDASNTVSGFKEQEEGDSPRKKKATAPSKNPAKGPAEAPTRKAAKPVPVEEDEEDYEDEEEILEEVAYPKTRKRVVEEEPEIVSSKKKVARGPEENEGKPATPSKKPW